MTVWQIASVVLLLGGLLPGAVLSSRAGPTDRLVGLSLTSSVSVLVMLVLSEVYGQPSYLIVPLVLATPSPAGVLVFTRLIAPR